MLSMDAQRFDITKSSRSHCSQPTADHEETFEPCDALSLLEFFSSSSNASSVTVANSDANHQVLDNSVIKASSSSDGLDARRYGLFKSQPECQTPSPEISPATTTCSSPILELDNDGSSDTDIESDQAREVEWLPTENEDVETNDEYTCTIVRPTPRPPIFSIFSRPSSPISLTSRPGSPINFGSLNCFGNSDNFEDFEVLQAQRVKKMAIQVCVTETKVVHREESWRDPLTELLYGLDPEGQARVVASRDESSHN